MKNSTGSLLVLLPLTLAMLLVTITLPMTTVLGQEDQNWNTYNSPDIGFKFHYPPDWNGYEYNYNDTSSMILDYNTTSSVTFGSFGVIKDPVEKYLDTDTLTLKTKTVQDYMREWIARIHSEPDQEFVKNISTTIGQNNYPASQIHYWGFKDDYNSVRQTQYLPVGWL